MTSRARSQAFLNAGNSPTLGPLISPPPTEDVELKSLLTVGNKTVGILSLKWRDAFAVSSSFGRFPV